MSDELVRAETALNGAEGQQDEAPVAPAAPAASPPRERWRPGRWSDGTQSERGRRVVNPRIDAFLDEIDQVCQRHGLAISHEDGHGAFEIVDYDEGSALDSAHDCTKAGP